MVSYKCNKCNKTFDHKNDYNKHIKRKKSCLPKKLKENILTCPDCDNTFNSEHNLNEHIHHCSAGKMNHTNNINKIFDNEKIDDGINITNVDLIKHVVFDCL